jgi:hypothetical protein
MTDRDEVIAAFVDGEQVDARVLDEALADPAGRACLIDVLALRGLVGDAGSSPAVARGRVARAMPADIVSGRSARPRWWLPAAATALMIAGAAGGYAVGKGAPGAPAPDMTATMDDAPPALMLSAPAPTRVFQLEPGRDWNERAGGD